MTVNELIAELQVLAAQGHGELDVTTMDDENGEHDLIGSTTIVYTAKKFDGCWSSWEQGEAIHVLLQTA